MATFCLSSPTILEPLLLFCTHAIRFRDTRSCGIVLRVLRSIIPSFVDRPRLPVSSAAMYSLPPAQAATVGPTAANIAIIEFISNSTLKAAITSLNESYFIDLQKDLAQLIASIITSYAPLTSTPRDILLSLPGMKDTSVDFAIRYLTRADVRGSSVAGGHVATRQQRAVVLDLLRDLRGVGVNEMGKINGAGGAGTDGGGSRQKRGTSKMQAKFMVAGGPEHDQMEMGTGEQKGPRVASPDLGGVADMFGA